MPHLSTILRRYHVARIARNHGFKFHLQHAKEISKVAHRLYHYEFNAAFHCIKADGACDALSLYNALLESLKHKLVVFTHWRTPYLCTLRSMRRVHGEKTYVLIHIVMDASRVFNAEHPVPSRTRSEPVDIRHASFVAARRRRARSVNPVSTVASTSRPVSVRVPVKPASVRASTAAATSSSRRATKSTSTRLSRTRPLSSKRLAPSHHASSRLSSARR